MSSFEVDPAALAQVYFFVSDQPLLLDDAVASVRAALSDDGPRAFNEQTFDGKRANAADVTQASRTLPMMARRRLVLVRDVGQMSKAEQVELAAYLDSPAPETVVVLTAAQIDKRSKLYKRGREYVHTLQAPRRLDEWIAAAARAQEVSVEADACRRLGEVVGADLARLRKCVEQLALFAGDRAVSVDDVDTLIADTRERSVFEWTDAIGAAQGPVALRLTQSLLRQRQSPLGVVMMLARHVRQIALFHLARSQRIPPAERAAFIGVPPFVVGKLERHAQNYSPRAVSSAVIAIAAADRRLKGVGDTGRALGRDLAGEVILFELVSGILESARRGARRAP